MGRGRIYGGVHDIFDLCYPCGEGGSGGGERQLHLTPVSCARLPLDRMLIETDSPYLAPVPHRGKTNNPSFVPFVAAALASLRGLPLETIAAQTTENFETLFAGVKA